MNVLLPASEIQLAHPGKRFQGQFIDSLLAYTLGTLAFYFLDLIINREYAVYAGFATGILYFLLSDALPNGQSLGKRFLNISVIHKLTKQPCTLFQSLLRNLTFPLGVFDWGLILFGQHRRLGDMIATTIVIKNDQKSR